MVRIRQGVCNVALPVTGHGWVAIIVCLLIERVGWLQKPASAKAKGVPLTLPTLRTRSRGTGWEGQGSRQTSRTQASALTQQMCDFWQALTYKITIPTPQSHREVQMS